MRKGLYAITPSSLPFQELYCKLQALLEAGVDLVQLRDKEGVLSFGQARALLKLCRRFGVPLIVNDDPLLARELGADGVHLGRDDPPLKRAREILGAGAIVGLSCYNRLELAEQAEREGADYVAFGAFYPTKSKEGTVRATPELLRRAKRRLKVPVVAIGGITPKNARPLLEAGADLIAAISSLFQGDPKEAVVRFRRVMGPPAPTTPRSRLPRAFRAGRTPGSRGA